MAAFTADADAIFTASTRFLSMKDYLTSVESGLVGDLQASSGMAGDDKAGRAFAAGYTPAASTIVRAIGVAAAGSAAISGKLLTMAWNYLITEPGSTTSVSDILNTATPTPLTGPIPPPTPPFSPELTGTARTAFNQWFARIPQGPVKPHNPSDLAYQLRIAGDTEYLLPTGVTSGPGQTMAADGVRPADGALIEAKNVRAPGCTPRTLSGIQSADRITGFLSPGDTAELAKYGQALAYPGTQARYLEIDTNDAAAVGYWQFLAAEQGVRTNVRYIT